MAALEIEGRISQKFPKQNGQSARGAWTKQDFILEYQDGSFPAQVCFTSFGTDKVADPVAPQEGDEGEEDSQPTNVPTHKGLSPMLLVTIVAIVAAVVATVGIVLLSRARRSTVTVKPSHLRKP